MSMCSSLTIQGAIVSIETLKHANNDPFMHRNTMNSSAIFDGLANTIFVGETKYNNSGAYCSNRWAMAWRFVDSLRSTVNHINYTAAYCSVSGDNEGTPSYGGFGSLHGEGANFAFGDGHVVFLRDRMDITLFRAISTIANGAMEAGYLTPPAN